MSKSWVALVVSFCATFAAYAVTLSHGVAFGDYGDFQVVAYILGIAYPTGFPGFTLFGWLWSHAVPFGSVALRMNVLSAVAAAAGNACLAGLLLEIGLSAFPAAIAALLFGLSYQVWTHAGTANAHEAGTALLFGALWAAVRWVSGGRPAMHGWAIGLFACAVAFDNTTLLALPGIAVALAGRRIVLRRAAPGLVLAAIGILLTYAYLPLRSLDVERRGLDPARVLGFGGDHQFWDQGHPSTVHDFLNVVTGGGFHAPHALLAMLLPAEMLRTWNDLTGQATVAFGGFALVLGVVAVIAFVRERRRLGISLLLISGLTALFLTAWGAESDVTRYAPRELLLVVVALAWAYARLERAAPRTAFAGRAVYAVLVMTVVLVQYGGYRHVARDRGALDASAVARLLDGLPAGSVVVAPWKYAAPLAYAAYVERPARRAVIVCCGASAVVARDAAHVMNDVFFVDDSRNVPHGFGFVAVPVASAPGVALWHLEAATAWRDLLDEPFLAWTDDFCLVVEPVW